MKEKGKKKQEWIQQVMNANQCNLERKTENLLQKQKEEQ